MKKNLIKNDKAPVLVKMGIPAVIFSWLALCGWTAQTPNDLKKAGWLIGTWENKTSRGSVYETWNRVTGDEFTGKSYRVKEKDTLVFETLRLVQEKDQLVYIPVVKNQNGGQPVRFAAKTVSDAALVFENLQHDFPQVISYVRVGADSLVAEISGVRNGQERKQTFPMKRVK